jgi:hypothetical protein
MPCQNRFVAIYPEVTPGVFPTGATPIWIRLPQDDAFSLYEQVGVHKIRASEAKNLPVQQVNGKRMLEGSLNTLAYPSQVEALLGLATADLATCTLPSFSIREYDGVERAEYNGCYFQNLVGTCSADTDEGVMSLSMAIRAMKIGTAPDGTAFPAPALSALPSELPYNFRETKGNLILGVPAANTVLTKYRSVSWTIENILESYYDEDEYPSDIVWQGRDVTSEIQARYKDKVEYTAYLQQAKRQFKIKWVRDNGVPADDTLEIDLKGASRIGDWKRSVPIMGPGYATIRVDGMYDSAAGTDFSFVVTP